MSIRVYGNSLATYDNWGAETEYSLADRVAPTVSNGKCYECTTNGTTGEDENVFTPATVCAPKILTYPSAFQPVAVY